MHFLGRGVFLTTLGVLVDVNGIDTSSDVVRPSTWTCEPVCMVIIASPGGSALAFIESGVDCDVTPAAAAKG